MSWAYKILILILSFIGMMIYFIFVAVQQDNPVIDKNYYERELQYQKLIDGSKNYQEITDKLVINNTQEGIKIGLPQINEAKIDSAKIEFLNVQNTKLDKIIYINDQTDNNIIIPPQELQSGRYLVRASINAGNKFYYTEEKINL